MYMEKCKKCRVRVYCVGICKYWCISYKFLLCMYVIDCNGLEIDVILDYILYSVKLVIFFCIILGI